MTLTNGSRRCRPCPCLAGFPRITRWANRMLQVFRGSVSALRMCMVVEKDTVEQLNRRPTFLSGVWAAMHACRALHPSSSETSTPGARSLSCLTSQGSGSLTIIPHNQAFVPLPTRSLPTLAIVRSWSHRLVLGGTPNSKVWIGIPQLAQNQPFVPYDWRFRWPQKAKAQQGS